jgi:broad specificity phosphatase PhoE
VSAEKVVLVRHAETEWSRAGRHTGRTDIPLTDRGRAAAERLAGRLADCGFALVLASPALRARETAALCGLGDAAQEREDLWEWDYGDYEGRTTSEIRSERPDWWLWRDGCPGGESPSDVGARADRVLAQIDRAEGTIAVVAHGHILRVLAARWISMEPAAGGRLLLSTGTLSLLGHEHATRVISRWNA